MGKDNINLVNEGGVTILTSDKADFKTLFKSKEGIFMMIKPSFMKISVLNLHASNYMASNYIE